MIELPRGFNQDIPKTVAKTIQKRRRGKTSTLNRPRPNYQLLIRFDHSIKMAELERFWILSAIDSCHGSISEAARMLGMARETVYRKVRLYNETK